MVAASEAMQMSTVLKTAPTAEPLTLDVAKAHCRVDDVDQDAVITAYIASARAAVEHFLKRRLITQTWTVVLDRFPSAILIPLAPVSQVAEIRHLDDAGEQVALEATAYRVALRGEPVRITPAYGSTWPSTRCVTEAVEVDVEVGYGAAGADVPPDILHALKLLVSHKHEMREAGVIGSVAELPFGVRDLLLPHVFYG